MKNKYTILGLFLLGFLILNSIIGISVASDDDGDGVDDDYEELNKRNIDLSFDSDEIEIDSILRNGGTIDEIDIYIWNDNDGIHFEFDYESEYSNESESEFELQFGVVFRKVIEYIDIDYDGIYNESIDQIIQEVVLNSFQNITYTESNISNDCKLHRFIINSTDGMFTAHISIAEEFDLINNTLITPTEIKIDLTINNFNYLNSTSQLALYVKLESEENFEDEDPTEDEKNGYATNEQGIISTNKKCLGFFTWSENATVDGVSKKVLASEILVDDDDDQEQKIYLSYPRGTHIYHDPKIGIVNLAKSKSNPFLPIAITGLILIIGLTITIAYSVNHFTGRRRIAPLLDEEKINTSKKLIQIFDEENALEKLSQLGDINLTALSENFFKVLEQFEWDFDEKEEFIKEMLALKPEEREEIIKEMMEKNNF